MLLFILLFISCPSFFRAKERAEELERLNAARLESSPERKKDILEAQKKAAEDARRKAEQDRKEREETKRNAAALQQIKDNGFFEMYNKFLSTGATASSAHLPSVVLLL